VTREPLDLAAVLAALDPERDGEWHLETVAETRSTNADLIAVARASDDAPREFGASRPATGAVLVAEHQTAARGRLDRVWTSPRSAGLTVSILLRPTCPVTTWSWLPLLTGLALRDALLNLAADRDSAALRGADISLKWPNDLLLGPDKRKVAGILVQTASDAAVLGIGLNVSTKRDELPVPTATSLAIEGWPTSREAILRELLSCLNRWYQAWLGKQGAASDSGLLDAYRGSCSTIGQLVSVEMSGAVRAGHAIGVDHLGRLIVDFADGTGEPTAVSAGDVTHVRPAGN
jgi:BirA family transcriptional regulator, biotin operon repressor / biotin---[acetyl-CoA-carboxylase] ligase